MLFIFMFVHFTPMENMGDNIHPKVHLNSLTFFQELPPALSSPIKKRLYRQQDTETDHNFSIKLIAFLQSSGKAKKLICIRF